MVEYDKIQNGEWPDLSPKHRKFIREIEGFVEIRQVFSKNRDGLGGTGTVHRTTMDFAFNIEPESGHNSSVYLNEDVVSNAKLRLGMVNINEYSMDSILEGIVNRVFNGELPEGVGVYEGVVNRPDDEFSHETWKCPHVKVVSQKGIIDDLADWIIELQMEYSSIKQRAKVE